MAYHFYKVSTIRHTQEVGQVIYVINRSAEYTDKEKSENVNFGYLGLHSKQLFFNTIIFLNRFYHSIN